MNRFESKYFNTAVKMNEAFLELLNQKEFEYITVKEICKLANVSRSTFYLHYETLNDLLVETGEYINQKFAFYFKDNYIDVRTQNINCLNFVMPEYLVPWLTFIKENKKLFRTFILRSETLGMPERYEHFFNEIFSPILTRYGVKNQNKEYILSYYVEGIIAIVNLWLKHDCDREITELTEIITGCVMGSEAFKNN